MNKEMRKDDKSKLLEDVLSKVLSEIQDGGGVKGVPPSVPGTVTIYEAMDHLSKKAEGLAETPEHRCARIAGEKVENKLKGKKSGFSGCGNFCYVYDVKDCACFGVDPDRPDTVSNCGAYYQASVIINTGGPEVNFYNMMEYAKELGKTCGRQTFIKQYQSRGLNASIQFQVVFRIGKPKNVKPAPKRKNRK